MSEITYTLIDVSEFNPDGDNSHLGGTVLRNPHSHVVQVTEDGRSLGPKSFAVMSPLDHHAELMVESGQLVIMTSTPPPPPPTVKPKAAAKSKRDSDDSEGPASE